MWLLKCTLMSLIVTRLSVSADSLEQKQQTLNILSSKNAQRADGVKPDVIPIFFYAREGSLEGDYKFKYETGNGISAEEHGVMTNKGTENEANSVVGAYRYTSPEGVPIEVTYTAGVDGFKAYGAHLPVGPSAPAASAPQNSAYKKAAPNSFARPQFRADATPEPVGSYPRPAAGGTAGAVVVPVQTLAASGSESRDQSDKTPVTEYYPQPQPSQPQSADPLARQKSAPVQPYALLPSPPYQLPAGPPPSNEFESAIFRASQSQAVQNGAVAGSTVSPPPSPPQQQQQQKQQQEQQQQKQQPFQQPSVLYQRSQASPVQPQLGFPASALFPQQPQAFPTPQPSRIPLQRVLVGPGYRAPTGQQQWFNAGPVVPSQAAFDQQRVLPVSQFSLEPQEMRYVPQSQYYRNLFPYSQRTVSEPPRY